MLTDILQNRDFYTEFMFGTSRSSGAGGQNVNKVNTKVELRFNITASTLLSDDEKQLLRNRYPNKINDEDEFILVCQTERSQLKNKEKVVEKFYKLLNIALTPKVTRRPTKRTKASVARRLDDKKKLSEKKAVRKLKMGDSE